MAPLLVFALILLSIYSSGTDGARQHGVSLAQDYALDLKVDTFNSSLWNAPSSWALVEFYAHWCPACRNYKKHYERVAKLFNGRNAPYPGILFMGKVDCADTVNVKLCERFSVGHYPMLLWGKPSKIAWGCFPKDKDSGMEVINTPRTADALLEWINKRIDKNFHLKHEEFGIDTSSKGASLAQLKSELFIHDIEEATAQAYKLIVEEEMLKQESRADFVRFLQLLIAHHPSKRCRRGSGEVLVNLHEAWPAQSDIQNGQPSIEFLQRLKICGEGLPRGYWISCRGSTNDTRGYSCGLWSLFHSLSVRVDNSEGNFALKAIRGFVANFFNCDECQRHFLKMSSSALDSVHTKHDLVLWFWRAHNMVNARLAKKEAELGTGDPKFPKIQWPPKELCPHCRSETSSENDWDESAVYSFLLDYYGHMHSEEQVGKVIFGNPKIDGAATGDDVASDGVVTVPIGAAFGIAIASCGFGAVACCWRMQQKKRKHLLQ